MAEEGHRVFVHCMHGKNRSVAAAVAYLVLHRGVPLDAAYRHVKHLRRQANVGERNTFHRELARIAKGEGGDTSSAGALASAAADAGGKTRAL